MLHLKFFCVVYIVYCLHYLLQLKPETFRVKVVFLLPLFFLYFPEGLELEQQIFKLQMCSLYYSGGLVSNSTYRSTHTLQKLQVVPVSELHGNKYP